MPFAAKVLCRGGCGKPVERGFCAVCQAKHKPALERKSSSARGYDYWWQQQRGFWLRDHPLCTDPYKRHAGQVVAATDVDHIIPHRGDETLRRDPNNWQSLCHECHSYKTALEDGGFGR